MTMDLLVDRLPPEWAGRSVDWNVHHGVRPGMLAPLVGSLERLGRGWLVAGMQKLVQRYLLLLLTPQGSMPYLPRRGTSFIALLRNGWVRTPSDLRAAFAISQTELLPQLRALEQRGDPPDERLASATLVGVELAGDHAILRIQLRSQAGDTTTFLLPIALSDAVGVP